MEGSSQSGWQKSDSSRGLKSSAISGRNLRLLHADRIGLSGDGSNDSQLRSERERTLVDHADFILKNQVDFSGICENEVGMDPFVRAIEWGDISLREWLDNPERTVDLLECLHIFRQIVEIVNVAHSQGIVVHNVRPSCFIMSSFNHVSFIESASCSDSGSDSFEDGLNSRSVDTKSASPLPLELRRQSRIESEDLRSEISPAGISPLTSEASCLQSGSILANQVPLEESEINKLADHKEIHQVEGKKQSFPMKQILLMESYWYTSPEESSGVTSSCASDIYRLGVLLFELFCTFSSTEEKSRTMSSLRHRVLPPQLLLKWPKEAPFCLWLLHPEPNCRPKMGHTIHLVGILHKSADTYLSPFGNCVFHNVWILTFLYTCDSELLESEFLYGPRDDLEEREAMLELREQIEEQELLLEFLLLNQQRKQEAANKLKNILSFLSSDIEEVMKQQTTLRRKGGSCPELGKNGEEALDHPSPNVGENEESTSLGSRKRVRGVQVRMLEELDPHLDGGYKSEKHIEHQESFLSKNSRLMKNFRKLESAYLLTRLGPTRQPLKPLTRHSQTSSDCRGSVVATERSSVNNLPLKEAHCDSKQSGWIDPFLEGLCKYLSFSKLKVKADLKQGDLLNSSSLVCSVSFDRDGEFFATAGVNKKIKVFECDSIINEDRDIHYPVVEMTSRSKLSCICWNGYIKSQIASSNFDGVVQVWDVTRRQVFMEMREHDRRVWSIDFSLADPTMLASGSDDGSDTSVGTIRTKANICCVQFPADSSRSLAFGSADHKIYYYDLRSSKMPLCTLVGHNKTVSYVKFVDSTNLVSASTDNTLKLWDLSMCNSRVVDSPLQSFTGHMNVKNFVGLSVSDGYIATGSETNEVFIYHKAFPMPALSFKFNSTDPLSGHEVDDGAQFISSVCWRGQSSMLVAANSTGNIKLLEMV
ncbi:WD40 repeat [Dillenia turbinata]|uniref:WD40 repeat n=1 Tax=Dillenia turbinata TaxID=194707 RepID=A0AAN8ZBJ9_9MAGN